MNKNIKLKDACIYYNPDTKKVFCIDIKKQETILKKGYWNDFGANWADWKHMTNPSRMLFVFAKANYISKIEKIPFQNFRDAFFDIVEMKNYLAINCL